LDFVMFGTEDLGHKGEKFKKFTIFIIHHIYPIFHAENNLSKLQFNFAHFIGPILTLCGPTSLYLLRLIDYLLFYVSLKNCSLIWKLYHYQCLLRVIER
jgi:hypothetical protein